MSAQRAILLRAVEILYESAAEAAPKGTVDPLPSPWHNYDDLIEKAMIAAMPQVAARRAERVRRSAYRRTHKLPKDAPVPPRPRPISDHRETQIGRHIIAMESLRRTCFEKAGEGKNRRIRLVSIPRPARRLYPHSQRSGR